MRNKKHDWTHVWYFLPRGGGKFNLPKKIMELHPVISEFCYQKILSATDLDAVNTHRIKNGELPVATGSLATVLENVEIA